MDKQDIEHYLGLLGIELQQRRVAADILLVGGAVMIVEVGNRTSTQDIDASFEKNAPAIRDAIVAIAKREGLRNDWLNDAAKGFLYTQPPVHLWRHFGGLNVYIPSLEYLLAMKLVAGRPRDIDDAKAIIQKLSMVTPQAVLNVLTRYVPQKRIDVRVQYLIEELFEE